MRENRQLQFPLLRSGRRRRGRRRRIVPTLLLELLFENGLEDTSENKHACRAHGNIEFVEGRGSGCASFDGKSWIDTGLLQKDLGSEFTVECWVIKPADYLAEVWLNGTRVGGHEGSETPFVLDVTDCVQLRQKNLLAVRRSKVEESWL